MHIELSTASKRSPLEILDLQVSSQRTLGKSAIALQFLCRGGRTLNHLHIPTLSWFDANQLQKFSQKLSALHAFDTHWVDLPDAGLRLTGSAQRGTTGRTIRIEPLAASGNSFSPFTIQASHHDVKAYAGKLYSRLWEFFTKG